VSVPVDLGDVAQHLAERGPVAYLLTVSPGDRPHAVATEVAIDGRTLVCRTGNRSAANTGERPSVSLLWPARHPSDYSLIVDGDGEVVGDGDDRRIHVRLSSAVLHRPAARTDAAGRAAAEARGCAADCMPLDVGSA